MTPEKSEAPRRQPRTYGTLMLGVNSHQEYVIWHSPSTVVLSSHPRDIDDRVQSFRAIWRFVAASDALEMNPVLEPGFIRNMTTWEAQAASSYGLTGEQPCENDS